MQQVFSKALRFWRTYGTKALIWRLRGELSKRMGRHGASQPASSFLPGTPSPVTTIRTSAQTLLNQRFLALKPLTCFQLPRAHSKRVNIVTDSINAGSLFGGVGTALILATLLANRIGANLRIITRTEPAQAANLDHLLSVYGMHLENESEFVFLPTHDTRQSVDFSDNDIFITTSWWTTAATIAAIPAKLVWYLLQEDERMFYPYGDDRVACEQVLQRKDLRFLLNTKLLYEHLLSEGMPHLQTQGTWFEPAFPVEVYYPRTRHVNTKHQFIFYARPHNLRNLFYLGLAVIDAAVVRGVLDPEKWDIILMGKDIPDVTFGDGIVPRRMQNMNWSAYAELVGSVDLGLCLMSTPHPSYPPLDLAASGAVVVTNSFGNKQSLQRYSDNLLCANPEKDALVAALAEGVALALNSERRRYNFEHRGLGQRWDSELEKVIQHMQEHS